MLGITPLGWITENGAGVSGKGLGHVGRGDLTTIMRAFHCFNHRIVNGMSWGMCPGRAESTPHPLLFTPQLAHSMPLTHRAMVEQGAGRWNPQGHQRPLRLRRGAPSWIDTWVREHERSLAGYWVLSKTTTPQGPRHLALSEMSMETSGPPRRLCHDQLGY